MAQKCVAVRVLLSPVPHTWPSSDWLPGDGLTGKADGTCKPLIELDLPHHTGCDYGESVV